LHRVTREVPDFEALIYRFERIISVLGRSQKTSSVTFATLQPSVYKVDKYPFLSVGQDALR
jgi:hypothetical protein